jgi:hypothetical protein
MDKDEKLIWRAFHRAEKRLFDYLVDNCDCLFSVEGDEPAYLEYANRHGVTLEKPPRFVHWIGQLRTSEIDYWHMAEQVQELYQAALGAKFKNYPVRFPQFYRGVEQINVSSSTAFESKAVKGSELILKESLISDPEKEKWVREAFEADIEMLADIAFPTPEIRNTLKILPFGGVQECLELVISTDLLFDYAGTSNIQKRRMTGMAYRARVRFSGQSFAHPRKLGLMVIDQDSDVSIVQANKQAPRPHALAVSGDQLRLPITLDFQLFRKWSESEQHQYDADLLQYVFYDNTTDLHTLGVRRSRLVHRYIADMIRTKPELLSVAKVRIEKEIAEKQPINPGDAAYEWQNILATWPLDDILNFMVADTEKADQLRSSTPFQGYFDNKERWKLHKAFCQLNKNKT